MGGRQGQHLPLPRPHESVFPGRHALATVRYNRNAGEPAPDRGGLQELGARRHVPKPEGYVILIATRNDAFAILSAINGNRCSPKTPE